MYCLGPTVLGVRLLGFLRLGVRCKLCGGANKPEPRLRVKGLLARTLNPCLEENLVPCLVQLSYDILMLAVWGP